MYMYLLGDTEVQLSRYLLRTLCSDLANTVLIYLAEDSGMDTPSHGQGEMTAKVGRANMCVIRLKTLCALDMLTGV